MRVHLGVWRWDRDLCEGAPVCTANLRVRLEQFPDTWLNHSEERAMGMEDFSIHLVAHDISLSQ